MVLRLFALITWLAALGVLGAVVLAREAEGQLPPTPSATTTAEPAPEPPPATEPPAQPDSTPRIAWRSRTLGLALSHPRAWSLRTEPGGFGSRRLCLELATEARPGPVAHHGSRAPEEGAEIRVVETRGGRDARNLTPPFSLDRLDSGERAGWTSGGLYSLRKHGRTLAIGVAVGAAANEATKREVERVIASVEIARSGRCLPRAATRIRWRDSRPVGLPYAGRLIGGVQLPREGHHFFTWDPVLRRSPDRAGRRWGASGVVRRTLAIVAAFAAAHPRAPRVGIGDLSRRHGGPFGPKHASHQNGLDVDVYYPRKDRKERPPQTPAQVDRRLAQDLVDRFVAAGATKVFVGPNVRLRGPRGVVEPLWNHDNHLHARFPPSRA